MYSQYRRTLHRNARLALSHSYFRNVCWANLTRKFNMFAIVSFVTAIFLVVGCLCQDDFYSSADTGEAFRAYSSDYFNSWPGYEVKQEHSPHEDLPIIVWWTDGGNLSPHGLGANGASYARLTCHNGASCYSTTNRDQQLLTDKRTRGFWFYGTDFDPLDLPLPRLQHHQWALFHEESPLNNYVLAHDSVMRLFNYTSTFRRESDYPLSTQAIIHPDYLVRRQPLSTQQKNEARKSKGLAPIVYVQSHCDVPSDRDSYVKELMKYIDIDSYGACLHNKNLPQNLLEPAENFLHEDFLNLLSEYKFNLAFENAYCNDYMTEKIMRPLHIGVVPIYKGSPVVQDWMPNNHSIILVDNFSSPKELAEYIKRLDENDEEYERFLEFKKKDIENTFLQDHLQKREWSEGMKDFFRGFECYLCKELNARMETEKAHAEDPSVPLLPPKVANDSHLGCPTPQRLDVGHGISDRWPEIDWTSLYWDGVDRARAVQRMIESGESDSKQFEKYLWEQM